MNTLHDWLVCERTRSLLALLENHIESAVATADLRLRVLALYLIAQGGKRLRPALVFLGASWGRWEEKRLFPAAAAMELIHVGSLHHDDIMDRATLRRNILSANAKWGNTLAALTGTFLVARAILALSDLGSAVNQLASQATLDLATGQLMEVENAYNLDLTPELHLEILRRKTATLFELPLRLGALLSDAPVAERESLADYGRNLGLAFQIVDDVLDLTEKSKSLGKNVGSDLRQGVYSLAVLHGLRPARSESERLRAILGKAELTYADIQEVRQIIIEAGLLAVALGQAEHYIRTAESSLQALSDCSARESLQRLSAFTLERSS